MMQLFTNETINLLLYVTGVIALVMILIYTALAGENVEDEDENSD